MKYLFLIILSFLLFINCQTRNEQEIQRESTINIKILPLDLAPTDTVYLSLYPLEWFVASHFGYNEKSEDTPIYALSITDSTFSFPVKKGYYRLVALTFGFEPVREALMIPDSSIDLDIKINFVPRGIDHKVKSVRIYGDFCDWNIFRGKELTRYDGIWRLEDASFLKPGSEYLLFPEQTRNYYDLNNRKYTINKKSGTFNSVYHGNEILFDPAQYKSPLRKSTVQYSGFDKQIDFSNLIRELDNFHSPRGIIRLRRMKNSERDSIYHNLEKEYAGKFDQVILHEKIWSFRYFHPFSKELSRIEKTEKEKLRQFYSDSLYKSYFNEMMRLVKTIEPSSEFFSSRSALHILELDKALKYAPELMEVHMPEREYQSNADMYEDFFVNYLDSLEKQGVPKMEGSHLLYYIANYYRDENKYEDVKRILVRLSSKYPNSGYNELIEKQFNSLSLNIGNKVPDFNLATSEGDSIKLTHIKNKYIFLYFWVGACEFSKRELPNVNRLHHSISHDKLKVIGITESITSNAKWIEEGYSLDFPNCLVSEDVLLEYGIIKYPTSYLLAPDGRIIVKDLRGEDLTGKVKEQLVNDKKHKN